MKKTKKSKKEFKISKKMTFAEILAKDPEAAYTLMQEGMHCMGCGFANVETLEQGCLGHGLNPDEIVKKLNKRGKNGIHR